jgi:hypothetical protein
MSRPPDYEWAVLGEGEDPIPGDPYEVRQEATRLGKMAQTISDQIKLLNDIAGDENRGRFKDGLVSKAEEVKGDLGKVAKRYQSVSGYLGNWASDLEYCQSESIKALTRAQQAAPTANTPQLEPASHEHLTDEQKQRQAAADKARSAAQDEINAAKRQLDRAKQHRDDRGRYWKGKIEASDHDDLKDSTWDKFKNFVHEHAELIKVLADICTWVVTALVIASLLIPGLDIATGLLAGLMLAALAGHTALALSGDGSWMDVAMDVFALVTLGTTSLAKVGLEGVVDTANVAAKGLEGAGDAEEAAGALAKAGQDVAEPAEEVSQSLSGRVADSLSTWGKAVGKKFVMGGEKDIVEHMDRLNELAEKFPDSLILKSGPKAASFFVNQARIAFGAANLADQFGHWAGGSDAVNFVNNAVHGEGFESPVFHDGFHPGALLHPQVEVEDRKPLMPGWAEYGKLKELTTAGIGS